jgi:hypothetical protein
MPSDLGAPELTESHRKSAYTLLHVDRFVPFPAYLFFNLNDS